VVKLYKKNCEELKSNINLKYQISHESIILFIKIKTKPYKIKSKNAFINIKEKTFVKRSANEKINL